ncbi:Inner membrane protein YaaH [Sporomusa ovata DSM 2662]|uniref:Membrane protein, putative n=1 Tax=Sporomusa ovata TaxID=2378 RepID=A0A0U1L3D9_9FIRM|nr:GPR1/FUN34/YaaH family transporter [Sporomusa ovata]EQB25461.1 GPR1/FUN34/yaaH family protein [Sporomusa ovata DSM 2662]CQR74025.1 membrane protein, putative [Sporomusa ovata]
MSNTNGNTQMVKIVTADPGGLGLFGLAMVTLVASSQKLGWTTGLAFVIPWAVFLGAFAQLIASFNDFKHNNTFGATAFAAYGLFWLGIATSWLIKMGVFGAALAADVNGAQLGIAFIGYFIFTVFMTLGAMETHKVLFIIFFLIDILFLGLAADALGFGHIWHTIAAWAEFAIAIVSFYGSAAATLNTHFGKKFLPVGKPFGIFK